MNSESKDLNIEREASARSRRAFLTMGVSGAAGYGGWTWLRSRHQEGGVESPLRAMLQRNEAIAGAGFSNHHLSPLIARSEVNPATRTNGDIGLGDDFDPANWTLSASFDGGVARKVTMSQIRELPRVEQITQLNCIEGWTVVVQWAGARFADFSAKYIPRLRDYRYVSLETPDGEYFVGLDAASALHPQTLLCYEMNSADLTSAHGAPLRLVIPVKYGVKNIKRIGRITFTNDRPKDYWANEGYDWYAGL